MQLIPNTQWAKNLSHWVTSFRGNIPPPTRTHRQDRLQYTAPQLR